MKIINNLITIAVMFAWFMAEIGLLYGIMYLAHVVGVPLIAILAIVFVYILQMCSSFILMDKFILYMEERRIR